MNVAYQKLYDKYLMNINIDTLTKCMVSSVNFIFK